MKFVACNAIPSISKFRSEQYRFAFPMALGAEQLALGGIDEATDPSIDVLPSFAV
jgi:hypothetical protein